MNIDFINNLLFGSNQKKNSQKGKNIGYFFILLLLLVFLYFLKDLLVFFFQNNYIISVVSLTIYIIYGIKKNNWVKGSQGFLISIVLVSIFLGTKLQSSSYFLKLKKYSEFHHTSTGSELWFNLKVNRDNTYEIQVAQPVDGKWGEVKKGKTSKLIKQRYTDTGQEYYCFYLEDYPFLNERTMVAFENAFSIAELKFNSAHYLLRDGDDDNPWTK